MIAQHAAEGGVLGKVEKDYESLGDDRVLTQTLAGQRESLQTQLSEPRVLVPETAQILGKTNILHDHE